MSAPEAAGSFVVVDDQLALLAALGILPVPPDTTIVTTYGWQQRILGAFVAPRAAEGQLQRIAAGASVTAAAVIEAIGSPNEEHLTVADPRDTAVDIARARVSGANSLAAETIAAAESYGAVVRVSVGNSTGHVSERVGRSGLDLAVWDPFPSSPA